MSKSILFPVVSFLSNSQNGTMGNRKSFTMWCELSVIQKLPLRHLSVELLALI